MMRWIAFDITQGFGSRRQQYLGEELVQNPHHHHHRVAQKGSPHSSTDTFLCRYFNEKEKPQTESVFTQGFLLPIVRKEEVEC